MDAQTYQQLRLISEFYGSPMVRIIRRFIHREARTISEEPVDYNGPCDEFTQKVERYQQFLVTFWGSSMIRWYSPDIIRVVDEILDDIAEIYPKGVLALCLRYGLKKQSVKLTFKAIGKSFDVTPTRARQIINRAIRHICHPRHSKKLRPFLIEIEE